MWDKALGGFQSERRCRVQRQSPGKARRLSMRLIIPREFGLQHRAANQHLNLDAAQFRPSDLAANL